MKVFLALFVILYFSPAIMAKSLEVQVNGMVCSFCAQGIESKFKELKEVQNIDVVLEKKLVSIKLKDKATLSDEQVKKLIASSGYHVVSIKRNDK